MSTQTARGPVSGYAPVITVDGPAGSGKTTLGRRLAVRLNLPLIDTGLFYRAVSVAVIQAGLPVSDQAGVEALLEHFDVEINTDPLLRAGWEIRLAGADVSRMARDPELAVTLATISRMPPVREKLLPLQRAWGGSGAVAVGRDCGTVIFPLAPVKFYLVAPEETRSLRRRQEIAARGVPVSDQLLQAEIGDRDALDAASSEMARDAILVDTSTRSADEVAEFALDVCRSRLPVKRSN